MGGAGFTFRPDKTMIAARSIEFLGYRIGHGHIQPDDDKVAQIKRMPFPKDPVSMRAFVGLVQYCASHVPRCAQKLGPLQQRADAGIASEPTEEELTAFTELREWLVDERGPVLALPDFNKPFYLLCDASDLYGMGSVLVQLDDQGHEKVVAYYSRRWRDAEARWHSLEHECCCVYESIKRFSHYLFNKFYVITDAEPLVWLQRMKAPKDKYAYWCMELQSHDFEIHHRPGELNKAADSVSRLAHIMPEHRPGRLVHSLIEGQLEDVKRIVASLPSVADLVGGAAKAELAEGAPASSVEQSVEDEECEEALPSDGGLAALDMVAPLAQALASAELQDAKEARVVAAAYSEGSFNNKEIRAVVFSRTALLAIRGEAAGEETLALPAARKEHKKEPLAQVAARALAPIIEGGRAHALELIGDGRYSMPSGAGGRHLLIPLTEEEAGRVHEVGDAIWIDLTEQERGLHTLGWEKEGDGRVARRLQIMAAELSEPAVLHPALQAAVDAAWQQPGRAVAAIRNAAAIYEDLDTKARHGTEDGRLGDGRATPMAPLANDEEVQEALGQLRARLEVQADLPLLCHMGVKATMSVDFEYFSDFKGKSQSMVLSLAQVTCGDLIVIFDVLRAPQVVTERCIRGEPTLSYWLEAPHILKVVQSCTSDTRLLRSMHVNMGPVFDTALADTIIRRNVQQRKLDVLVDEYVEEGLMILKTDMTTALHAVVWRQRPLPYFAVVYAWQDTAWGERLFQAQAALLEAQGLLPMQLEISRHAAEMDSAAAPSTMASAGLLVRCDGCLYLQPKGVVRTVVVPRQDGVRVEIRSMLEVPRICFHDVEQPTMHVKGAVIAALTPAAGIEPKAARAFAHQLRVQTSKRRYVRHDGCGQYYVEVVCSDEGVAAPVLAQAGLWPVAVAEAAAALDTELDRRAALKAHHSAIMSAAPPAGKSVAVVMHDPRVDLNYVSSPEGDGEGVGEGGARDVDGGAARGLRGGAAGDGLHAYYSNVRGRKVTANPLGPGLAVRTFLCHGRSENPEPYSYDVTFDDQPTRRTRTDLRPHLRVADDAPFPSSDLPAAEQWQLFGHPRVDSLPPGTAGGVCPTCFFPSEEDVCPVCGRDPSARQPRRRAQEGPAPPRKALRKDSNLGERLGACAAEALGGASASSRKSLQAATDCCRSRRAATAEEVGEACVHAGRMVSAIIEEDRRLRASTPEGGAIAEEEERTRLMEKLKFRAPKVMAHLRATGTRVHVRLRVMDSSYDDAADDVSEEAGGSSTNEVANSKARNIGAQETGRDSMRPNNPYASGQADVVCPELRAMHDEHAEAGLRRGLSIQSEGAETDLPKLLAICTGRVFASGARCTNSQRRYAVGLARTGFTLRSNPLHNAWVLANEPREGERANCIIQMVDLHLDPEDAEDTREQAEQRTEPGASATRRLPSRAAKQEANTKLREGGGLRLAVALLVQVAPAGPRGELTVHYGDGYARDYPVGEPPERARYVTIDQVEELYAQLGFSRREMVSSLALCGAPLDAHTKKHCDAVRATAMKIPHVSGDGNDLVGSLTVPSVYPEADEGREVAELHLDVETAAGRVAAEGSVAGRTWDPAIDLNYAESDDEDAASATVDETDAARRRWMASAGKKGTRPPAATGQLTERQGKFVTVVVHDGRRTVLLATSKKVPMGEVRDDVASITGKVTELFYGRYAAESAVRKRLGPVWDYPALNLVRGDLKLLGATRRGSTDTLWYEIRLTLSAETIDVLRSCHESRRPTPTDAAMFTGLVLMKPTELVDVSHDGTTIASIITGNASMLPVRTVDVEVPQVMSSKGLQKGEGYQAGVETEHQLRAFYDLGESTETMPDPEKERRRVIAPFYTALPDPAKLEPVATADAAEGGRRITRRAIEDLLAAEDELRRDLSIDFEDEAGRERDVETDDERQDDREDRTGEGREASYRLPAMHPYANGPQAFLRRMRPMGLDVNFTRRIREAQRMDTACQEKVRQIEQWRRLQLELPVAAEVAVSVGGQVRLQLSAVSTPRSRKEARRQENMLQQVSEDFLTGADGMLYHIGEDRLGQPVLEYVVPEPCRQWLLEAAHDSMLHLGRNRTLDALKGSRVWWAKMGASVKRYVRRCKTCAFNKTGPHVGEMQVPPDGFRPWQYVTVDVVHLDKTASGNCKAVIFNDRFGRGVRAFPATEHLDSETFLNIVAFGLVPDVGLPRMMISDRGSNLTSALCLEFYKHFGGIDPRIADAHMHTAVGLTERFNATLREMSRAAYFDTMSEWDLYLPYLVMFYNATVQASTGYSPYFIEHGREPTLPWHAADVVAEGGADGDGSISAYVKKHLLGLHLAQEACYCNLEEAERQRKERHDGKYQTGVAFGLGDRVLLLQPGRVSKMDMPYVGPFRIVQVLDRDRYALRDMHGRRYHNEFHVSKLKLWPEDDILDDDYYVIEEIVDSRVKQDGTREWRVRWRGYGAKSDTWEALDNMNEAAREAVQEFDRRRAPEEDRAVTDEPLATNEDAVATDAGTSGTAGPKKGKGPKKKKQDMTKEQVEEDQLSKVDAQKTARELRELARAARYEAQGHY